MCGGESVEGNRSFKVKTSLPSCYHPTIRLNSICPYYTMFPLAFPYDALSIAKRGDWVLDPFCGRGTTNYAARLWRLPSVGLDTCDVALAISSSKLVKVEPSDVTRLCSDILNNSKPSAVPQGPFWELCFHPSTLHQICQIREALLDSDYGEEGVALRAIMLGILHGPRNKNTVSYLSNQMPRTYSSKPAYSVGYWQKRDLRPPNIDVLELITRRASYVFQSVPQRTPGTIVKADSRLPISVNPEVEFRWVVTSPPYLGMMTYIQDQWLRDWFVGGPDSLGYSKPGQITRISTEGFIDDLAKVWRNVADRCAPDAQMLIRFGTLPSFKGSPSSILEDSLVKADRGWRVKSMESAGQATRGARQSEQFHIKLGKAGQEVDCVAVLA